PVLKQGLESVGRTLSSPAGPGGVGNFSLVLPAMGEYYQYYTDWNTSFTNAERQRREFEETRKAQEEALRRQQRETARLNTYMSNVESGDLSGPGTPPTVISGGSRNVDASRLDLGRGSTARR